MALPNPGLARDYEDAMMVARRAKNWLFLLILLMLMAQIGIFFAARLTSYMLPEPVKAAAPVIDLQPAVPPAALATTAPADSSAKDQAARANLLREGLWYVTAGIHFLGVIFGLLLIMCLLLIVNIMVIRRDIGLTKVTSAWIWCVLLVLLLIPWQSFMSGTFLNNFRLPGVLYSWSDLTDPIEGAKFGQLTPLDFGPTILRWARFVIWPSVAIILLLMVQAKSSRGIRAALGETEYESSGEIVS